VQSSFDRLAIFAQQHDLSFSLAAFYVLVGSLNILPLDGGRMIFEPVSPSRLARVARMEPKTVSRWCTQLSQRGLLNRKRGAYCVERLADCYVLAGCMQTGPLAPLPGLFPASEVWSSAAGG
jgi:DNA-binding MarR family transcriptional regulator